MLSRMKSSETGPVISLMKNAAPTTRRIAARLPRTSAVVFQNRRKLRSPD
jgi:hypothetical protein